MFSENSISLKSYEINWHICLELCIFIKIFRQFLLRIKKKTFKEDLVETV